MGLSQDSLCSAMKMTKSMLTSSPNLQGSACKVFKLVLKVISMHCKILEIF